MDASIGSPLQKRREEWFRKLAEGLEELANRVSAVEATSLADNEDFIDVVYAATDAAMRTHQEEKIDALRSVVLNAAVGISLDEALRGLFLNYIQSFSPAHLRMLKVLQNPRDIEAVRNLLKRLGMGGLEQVIATALPEIASNRGLLHRVYSDLEGAGLVVGGMNVTMTGAGLGEKRTTDIGDAFLEFIEKP